MEVGGQVDLKKNKKGQSFKNRIQVCIYPAPLVRAEYDTKLHQVKSLRIPALNCQKCLNLFLTIDNPFFPSFLMYFESKIIINKFILYK